MAGAYSNSIHKAETPQYAYALAILSGGISIIVPQLGVPVPTWFSYLLLAALFGSIWPTKALQWGIWLCLPIVLLMFIDIVVAGNIVGVLLSSGIMLAKAVVSACTGAYVGSKLSVRKFHLSKREVRRNRSQSNGHATIPRPVLKELTAPTAADTVSSNQNSNDNIETVKPAAHSPSLNAALIRAIQEGDVDRIKRLVADGADVDAGSGDQWSPLMFAAFGYDVEMIKTLFGQGAEFNQSGGQGWTALMIATFEGHLEVVRALLECGAQVNAANNKGWTALRFAVSMDETEILRLLINAGANVNLADHEGKTALMQAAGENIKECLKALLDAGADPRLKDHKEQTALIIAERHGHTEIVNLLLEAEAKTSSHLKAPTHNPDDGNAKVTDTRMELSSIPRPV